jgi:hypothetical protein
MRTAATKLAAAALLALAGATLPACQGAGPDLATLRSVDRGEFGQARAALSARLPADRADRAFLLERLKLLILDLGDGLPQITERLSAEIFDTLRTQGLNADKTVASVVINEDIKIWKGEPFEQAMAYHYIALARLMQNDWDNARAAAESSLFLLKDFGANERGERLTGEDLARRAARPASQGGSIDLDKSYTPRPSDFTLGRVMSGVASLALNRTQEAQEQFAQARAIRPELGPTLDTLASGSWNTLLVVDIGLGPQKVAYGPDNALSVFRPWPDARSDDRPLTVRLGEQSLSVPQACDLNTMAQDHRWNNLEDVRTAKSLFGTGMLVGGAALATSRSRDAQLAGLGLILAGAISKAGAHADTRYCEVLPQRVYLVPLKIDSANPALSLQLPGGPSVNLPGLTPPSAPERFQVRYVRVPAGPRGSPAWADAATPRYTHDRSLDRVPGDELPFIMGGTCVRTPAPATLQRYQSAGRLRGFTTADLENLYRAEGIAWTGADVMASPSPDTRHVLEGGRSLVAPLEGTTGFLRLFYAPHPPYAPRSRELIDAIARERAQSTPASDPRPPANTPAPR